MRPRIFGLLIVLFSGPAWGLDSAINYAARRYNVDPSIMRAIAHLESSGGRVAGLQKNSNGTYDLGPFQINSVHWSTTCKVYDIRTQLGNALCAARILAGHQRHARTDPYWAARYHSRTPSLKYKYYLKLQKYLKGVSK